MSFNYVNMAMFFLTGMDVSHFLDFFAGCVGGKQQIPRTEPV